MTSHPFRPGRRQGVGAAALESILEVRKESPFASLHDFCERVDLRKVNKKVIEALIKCGAFDSLGGRRAQYMEALEDAMEAGQRLQRERAVGQESLFGMEEVFSAAGNGHCNLPEIPEWPEKTLLSFEKEALGFFITGHPLARFRDTIRRFATCEAATLQERSDKEEVKVCGIVSAVKELTTKKGDRMAFATLEDLSGLVEMVLFPEVYAASSDLIKGEEPILVSGTLDIGEETCKLMVGEVVSLRDMQERQTKKVHFRLSSPGLDHDLLRGLKQIIRQFPGRCESFIHLVVPSQCEAVVGLPETLNVAATDELMEAADKLFGYQVVTFE
jgi:DNA polymerase III subunit alpha